MTATSKRLIRTMVERTERAIVAELQVLGGGSNRLFADDVGALEAALESALSPLVTDTTAGTPTLVIDLGNADGPLRTTHVEDMDSSCIGKLIRFNSNARRAGVRVLIANAGSCFARKLQVLKLTGLLPTFAKLEDALASLEPPSEQPAS